MTTPSKLPWVAAIVVVLAALPVLEASDLQVMWSELGPAVSGKTATLVLHDGARIHGKVRSVGPDALSMQVKGTSNAQAYPKGRILVPRKSVSHLELSRKTGAFRKVLVGVGVGLGSAVLIGAVSFWQAAAEVAPKENEDPAVSERRIKKYLIGIGALSVAVGTGFGIQAARKSRGGRTTVRVIRVVHEAE